MTGLDKIIEQILQEANVQADEIKAKAQVEADKIMSDAALSAEKIKADAELKADGLVKSGEVRAQSSSDLKKRQAILKAKQEIITDLIDKAHTQLLELPDEQYFEIVLKSLEKSVKAKEGVIYFSKKDAARVSASVSKKIEDIAAAKGGKLTLAKDYRDIDGGFVLVYGGIEENCSFKAMFDAEKEMLADKVNEFLFAGK